MDNLKIKTFGWKCPPLDVLSRIEEGFISLGHEIVDKNPDIIYCNNDFFDEPIKYAQDYPNSTIIYNILDLQLNNWTYDLKKLKLQLNQADIVTCISKTVQKQIWDTLQIKAKVIYNPIKDVKSIHGTEIAKSIPFLYVGRANCPNKRFSLIKDMFKLSGWDENIIFVCGSENPNFGQFQGIVDDNKLNLLYNLSKFVLLPSSSEGIGLSMIEGMVTGTIPILCNDNPTAHEFAPSDFICEPTPESLFNKVKELNNNYEHYQSIALEYGKKYQSIMNKEQIARNIISLYYEKN